MSATRENALKVWTITVYEQESTYDEYFDSPDDGATAHSGHDDVEPYEIGSETVAGDVHAVYAHLDDLGLGQWDGGSTAYDPDGSHMAADVDGTMTTRYANVQPVDFDVEAFIDGYVECALWADCMPADRCTHCGELLDYATVPGIEGWMHAETTSIGPRDHPAKRDENAESGGCDGLELRPGVRNKMAVDCLDFCAAEIEDLLAYCEARSYDPSQGSVESYAGHDFWLTRSGHGAGYWDRGLGELGDRLSEAASAYGTPDDHTPYDCGDGTADV